MTRCKRGILVLAAAGLAALGLLSCARAQDDTTWPAGQDMKLVDLQNMEVDGATDRGVWMGKLENASGKELMKKAKTFSRGAEHALGSFPASSVKSVSIRSAYCGVAVEPGAAEDIEILFYGEDPNRFSMNTKLLPGGTLEMSFQGNPNTALYANTYEEKRVNTFVVRVPGRLEGLRLDEGVGAATVYEVASSVAADTAGGVVRISGKELTGNYTLTAQNGWMTVDAANVGGTLDMKAQSGWVTVKAQEEIKGALTMTAVSGWATLNTEKLSGQVSMTAQSGWVTADAQVITGKGSFVAQEGWSTVNVDSLQSDIDVRAHQGWATLSLGKQPQNMRLDISDSSAANITVPTCFTDGGDGVYQIGNGKPSVQLEGSWVHVDIGKSRQDSSR